MTNQIDIDVENQGHVAGYTHEDYKLYLEEIASRKRFSVEFGDVSFLDIEVKDREFFNVAYKCLLRTYNKDETDYGLWKRKAWYEIQDFFTHY